MVFKGLRKKVKKVKASLEKTRAKRKRMTVTEYREYKKALAETRKLEQVKHAKWTIEEEFRRKRATVQRTGQSSRVLGVLKTMSLNAAENLGLVEPRKRKRKKSKKKHKKNKRKKRKNKRRR